MKTSLSDVPGNIKHYPRTKKPVIDVNVGAVANLNYSTKFPASYIVRVENTHQPAVHGSVRITDAAFMLRMANRV